MKSPLRCRHILTLICALPLPQVYTNQDGSVEALLVAVEPTATEASYIVIRPVKDFKPSNKD